MHLVSENATDIDYLITNEIDEKVSANWIVKTYTQRILDRSILSRNQRMARII